MWSRGHTGFAVFVLRGRMLIFGEGDGEDAPSALSGTLSSLLSSHSGERERKRSWSVHVDYKWYTDIAQTWREMRFYAQVWRLYARNFLCGKMHCKRESCFDRICNTCEELFTSTEMLASSAFSVVSGVRGTGCCWRLFSGSSSSTCRSQM